MHDGYPHHDHGHVHDHPPARAPRHGHNHRGGTLQWQTVHGGREQDRGDEQTRDVDLVEASFIEAFVTASDPTSFLRLAGIPFVGRDRAGLRFHLLRVEVEHVADVGAVTPLLGEAGMRYDPLPAAMASRRRRLAFA